MREEAAIIIQGCVDKTKHGSKMDAVLDREVKNNAQALIRRLDNFFGLGKTDGDVITAGKNLRNCSMRQSGLSVVEYGLKLEKLEKILNIMGVYTNEKLELIQIYLKGLAIFFKDIRAKIMYDLEPDYEGNIKWEPTLLEIKNLVELRAVRDNLLDIKAGPGSQISQNGQQGTKMTKAQKKQAKTTKDQNIVISNLKAQLEAVGVKGGTVIRSLVAAQATSGSAQVKQCSHGAKCWIEK